MLELQVDLVVTARAKMAEEKVNGPEDSFVTETIKQLPQEKMYEITNCFQTLFLPGGGHQLLEDRKNGIPTEPTC